MAHLQIVSLASLFVLMSCLEPPSPSQEGLDMNTEGSLLSRSEDEGEDLDRDLNPLNIEDTGAGSEDVDDVSDMGERDRSPNRDDSPALEPWPQEACEPESSLLQMGDEALKNQVEISRWRVGGPLGARQLIVYPSLSSDLEQYEIFSLSGGAVMSTGVDGEVQWQTSTTELKKLWGLYDFDGDGVEELLASSISRAYLFRLSNGQELWRSSPEDIGLGERLSSLSIVKVSESAEELFPSLYLADAGCSTEGTGYGVVYRFPMGFNTPEHQSINTPRVAGRCSRWQSLIRSPSSDDSSNMDELLVMLTDRYGLHGFSAKTGERHLCGHIDQELVVNRLPYTFIKGRDDLTWVSVVDDRVSSLELRSYQVTDLHCDEGDKVMGERWHTELIGASPIGFLHVDLNGDQEDELWVNYIDDHDSTERRWRTAILDGASGELLGHLESGVSLGQVSESVNEEGEEVIDLLITLDTPVERPLGETASSLQLLRLNLSELSQALYGESSLSPLLGEILWEEPILNSVPMWRESAHHDTSEFKRLQRIDHQGAAAVLLSIDTITASSPIDLDSSQRYLLIADQRGVVNQYGVEGQWGTAQALCSNSRACHSPNRVYLTESDGTVRILTSSLEEVHWPERAPQVVTGWISYQLTISDQETTLVLTQSQSGGNLSVFEIERDTLNARSVINEPRLLWQQQVSAFKQPGTQEPNPPLVIERATPKVVVAHDHRDPRFSDWVGFRLSDGEELWRHRLPAIRWRTEEQRLHGVTLIDDEEREILYRLDRALHPQALSELSPCEGGEHIYDVDQLFMINPECPSVSPSARVIHALDAETGSCIWRSIISEINMCVRPSLQHMSLIDGDQDGEEELYLFESAALRRLNPSTGELEGTALIPRRPDQRLVSGGWLKAHRGGLLRFGTYSAPDLYQLMGMSHELTTDPSMIDLVWFGETRDELRNQSWLLEWVALTSTGAWLSLGLNRPLARYNHRGELDRLLRLSVMEETDEEEELSVRVSQLTEEMIAEEGPDVISLREADSGGLIATTDEGGLFILDHEGSLEWGKVFRSLPGIPTFIDWDRDGVEEWIISTSNGDLIYYDQQTYLGVSKVWEASCSSPSECRELEDQDRFQVNEPVCVGWTLVDGLEGAQIQLQTQGGFPVTPWQETDLSGAVQLNPTPLTVGQKYRIGVKGWLSQNGQERVYTESSYSDGFIILDDAPPMVSLTLDRTQLILENGAVEPLMISISAIDQVQLSGWSLVIYDENGRFVKLVSTGSISEESFSRSERWTGLDRYERVVPKGRYKIFLAVTDVGGNQRNTESWITVE